MNSAISDRTATAETEKPNKKVNANKHSKTKISSNRGFGWYYLSFFIIIGIGIFFIFLVRNYASSYTSLQTVFNSDNEIIQTTTDSGVAQIETELISIIITAIIAGISGTFVFLQYRTVKNRDTIKCTCSYHSIKSTLENNYKNIATYILEYDNTDIQYIEALANEWMLGDEICKEIDELEHLLYEHGKKTDVNYIQDTINITSQMRVLVHKINITYNILRKDPTYKTKENLNKFEELYKSFEATAEEYEFNYFRKTTQSHKLEKDENK